MSRTPSWSASYTVGNTGTRHFACRHCHRSTVFVLSEKTDATHSPPEAFPENIAAAFNEGANAIYSAAMT